MATALYQQVPQSGPSQELVSKLRLRLRRSVAANAALVRKDTYESAEHAH